MGRVGDVLAVTGGQFGSEGKGVIVAHLAKRYDIHVRVGAPNAGHSYKVDGRKFVHQSVPVGMCNPEALLVVGAGALINMDVLAAEVEQFEQYDPNLRARLLVDANAGVIGPQHVAEEGHTSGEIHRRIGSTGEGVGAARRDRMMRDPERFVRFGQVAGDWGLDDLIHPNTAHTLENHRRAGANILLEGSQGSGLDLIHGPWPMVTSNGTGPAQLLADVGLGPRTLTQSLLVCRTHPIRVAGNSGPLHEELSWDALSERVGRPLVERTTVTKKVRRIGEWDWDLVHDAVYRHAPTSLALTFMDYLDPTVEGVSDPLEVLTNHPKVNQFRIMVEDKTGVPVVMLGTGGPDWSVVDHTGSPEGDGIRL